MYACTAPAAALAFSNLFVIKDSPRDRSRDQAARACSCLHQQPQAAACVRSQRTSKHQLPAADCVSIKMSAKLPACQWCQQWQCTMASASWPVAVLSPLPLLPLPLSVSLCLCLSLSLCLRDSPSLCDSVCFCVSVSLLCLSFASNWVSQGWPALASTPTLNSGQARMTRTTRSSRQAH